jgi:hypothetical protein
MIRLILLILALLGLIYAALILGLKGYMLHLIEQRPTPAPGVHTSIERIDLNLFNQRAKLYGFRMTQPTDFGEGLLLYLPELQGSIDSFGLLNGEIRIKQIQMEQAIVKLKADTNGLLNIQSILQSLPQNDAKTKAPSDAWPLSINALMITDGTIHYSEMTPTKEQIAFTINDLNVRLTDFRMASQPQQQGTDLKGELRATSTLRQAPFPNARWGVAAIAKTENNTHSRHFALRMIGIELATLAPVLPDNTAQILGGDALDFSMDINWQTNALSGRAVIETIAGYRYEALLSGTPDQPQWSVDDDAIKFILARSSGGLGNIIRNLRLTGTGAAGDLIGTTAEFSKEAVKTVGSLGEGLAETAKGLVTFDSETIGKGAKTVGSAFSGKAKKAVFDASGQIMTGVGNVHDNLSGDTRANEWRNNIPHRWTNAWHQILSDILDD